MRKRKTAKVDESEVYVVTTEAVKLQASAVVEVGGVRRTHTHRVTRELMNTCRIKQFCVYVSLNIIYCVRIL
jgi:hypothetical protein